MCERCDYPKLLTASGLEVTENRLRIIEVIGGNSAPLTAADVFQTVERTQPINRVTVYRILDLLVQHGVIERINGARAAHYGLAPNEHHVRHPHFCCSRCGTIDCLTPDSLSVDADQLRKTFAGEIARIEILVEGICKKCLKHPLNHR